MLARFSIRGRSCWRSSGSGRARRAVPLLRLRGDLLEGNPADCGQIADLTEERILQEMKLVAHGARSFPSYYLMNTPPPLMARQIMLNRSHELSGLNPKPTRR